MSGYGRDDGIQTTSQIVYQEREKPQGRILIAFIQIETYTGGSSCNGLKLLTEVSVNLVFVGVFVHSCVDVCILVHVSVLCARLTASELGSELSFRILSV